MERYGSARRLVWFRWWYVAIGVGFLLLATRAMILGDRPLNVGLRYVIGFGFLLLARVMFRGRQEKGGI
jgi:hypothetical protein